MEQFIKDYAKKVKDLIVNKEELCNDELEFEIEMICDRYYNILEKESDYGNKILEGEKVVSGLIKKLERIHSLRVYSYDRDNCTHLAERIDLGLFIEEPKCPYDSNDKETLGKLQKSVTLFMAKRAKVDPNEEDPLFADVLLTGKPNHQLEEKRMKSIIGTLIDLTHGFVDYIEYYKPHLWFWEVDCITISQYIFEKIAELTYLIYKRKNTDNWSYDIRDAFQWFEINTSEELKYQLYNKIETLENLVSETISFISKNDIQTCDFEIWLRPIFFNIGVQAIQFTLEQEKL